MCDYPNCEVDPTQSLPLPAAAAPMPDATRTFKLCPTHANAAVFLRPRCRNCTDYVKIGAVNILANTAYGPEGTVYLCGACDARRPIVCDGCPNLLGMDGGKQFLNFQPYGDGTIRLCEDCEPRIVARCGLCDEPAAVGPGLHSYTRLTGARTVTAGVSGAVVGWRCKVCAAGALESVAAAQRYYDEAVTWMRRWMQDCGEAYPEYRAGLTWDLAPDGTIDPKGTHPRGVCRSVAGYPGQHRILILTHMRPILFLGSLVHELTHAWANANDVGNKPLNEGFCNYAADRFLRQRYPQDAEAQRYIRKMETAHDPLYGRNYLTVRAQLDQQPEKAFTWYRAS